MIGPASLAILATMQPHEIPGAYRDVLTGAPLQPGAEIHVIREPTFRTRPKYLDHAEDTEAALPLKLNTRTPEAWGLQFSTDMARLLDADIAGELKRARESDAAWWEQPYCRERVHRDLLDLIAPPARAERVFQIMCQIGWEIRTPAEAAEESRIPLGRILEWARLTERLAKRPPGRTAREWMRWHTKPATKAA